MSPSLSKIPIKITLIGKGEAKAELNRLTAPLTVEEISRILPINSRVSPAFGFISVLVGLKRGAEKPISKVKAGTIAYWPKGDAICIYPQNYTPSGPLNKIGKITEGLELFQKVRSGTRIKIEAIR